jgi:tetratricopeptide (TPR) repeat protein
MARHLALALLLALAPVCAAQDDPAPAQGEAPLPRTPHAREIRSLIRAIGADDWAAREAARERLLEIGPEAMPWLERAARDPDAQRAQIAQELVRTLRWQVPADVRETIGDALDDFPALAQEQRLQALGRVAQLGPQARAAAAFIINVARFDPDAQVRHTAVEAYLLCTVGDVPEQDEAALAALADEKQPGPLTFILRSKLLKRLGRMEQAIRSAGQAYLQARGNAQLGCFVVDLLVEAKDVDAALPIITEVEAANPEDLEVRIRAGEVLALSGRTEEGLAKLRSVGQTAGIEAQEQLLLRLGRAFLRCEQVPEAEKLFRAALGRFPYSRELNVALADVFLEAGRAPQAVQMYLSEIRYATPGTPGWMGLRQRLGDVLRRGGADALADDDAFYDDARAGKNVIQVRQAVAGWLAARGLQAEAVTELRAAAALSPADAIVRVKLGDALRDQGLAREARGAYEDAARIDTQCVAGARLRDLAGLEAQQAQARREEGDTGGFRDWSWQMTADRVAQTTESVTSDAAPPVLVLREQVVVPVSGAVDLFGLSAADLSQLWRYTPEPPPSEAGTATEQVGLELVALVEAPAATVAATDPRRAREGTPLVVALYNSYWRPVHRSWRAARFTGLHAYLIDPKDGKALGRRTLDDVAQVVAPAPVARRGRALAYACPRARRVVIELLDLVRGRPLWQTALPFVTLRRPAFADDRAIVAWDAGVVALDAEGKKVWGYEHERSTDPEATTEEGPPRTTLTTEVARCGDGVVVGASDGRLLRLALADGRVEELFKVGEQRLTGEVVVEGQRLYVAERGGAVHALALEADLARVTSRAWTNPGPKAAARTLSWAGGLLFALNGSDDAFADERPLLLALDPATGKPLLQRPVDRPATLSTGHELVVISSGGRGSRMGLRVLGIRPAERLDARVTKLRDLEAAARDALFEGQLEVSAVLARMYVRAAGGHDLLDADALAFVARTLARSKRQSEALDVINIGEERAGDDAQKQTLWGELRKELGLEETPPPEQPQQQQPPPRDPNKPG